MLRGIFSDPAGTLLAMLYTLPGILIALSFHEFAHAWVAVKMGDNTPKFQGRLTLDPFKHLDPIGFLSLLIFHFGWAKPVYIVPRNFRNIRMGSILVSIAGVVMNFLLGIVFVFLLVLGVKLGIQTGIYYNIISFAASINFTLMVFNFLPIPPLDGYQFVRDVFGVRSMGFLSIFERYGFLILLVLMFSGAIGYILNFVITPIYGVAIQLFSAILGVPS